MEKIEPQMVAIGRRCELFTVAEDQTVVVVVSPSKKRKVDSGRDSKSLDDYNNNGTAFSSSAPKPASPIDCCDDFAARRHGRFPQSVACSYDSSEDLVADYFKRRDDTHTLVSSQIDNGSSPESEVCVVATEGEMESKSTASTQSRSVTYHQTPTAEEIEEFFAAADKIEAQRFARKYNFDIVNDVPLEGRFEWSQVKL